MNVSESAQIHPTALVSADCVMGPGVRIEAFAIIEGAVTLGAGTIVRPHAHLIGELVLGERNDIGTGVVLGARPQHLSYQGAPCRTVVGHNNVFREHATVHGSFIAGAATRIGDRNYFMVNTHIGHDSCVGNDCIFVNGALVAGHCTIEDRAMLSGNCAIHQFGKMGKVSLLSGGGMATKDVPPFAIISDRSQFRGVNVIGMRRAGYTASAVAAVRKAYQWLYSGTLMQKLAIAKIEAELGQHEAVAEIIRFVKASKRGIPGAHFGKKEALADAA
jgi:UDP-N-acetylglucosamine acyltransferase